MITSISQSIDLAAILNAEPATEADANETPRDWPGIWVGGDTYELDQAIATDTFTALKDGTAAVTFSPQGEHCRGSHRTAVESESAHWCVADTDSWTADEDARGVNRDWRAVTVWDANGFSMTDIYDTVDEAKSAFDREAKDLETLTEELNAEYADE